MSQGFAPAVAHKISHRRRYNDAMPQRAYRFRFYPNATQRRSLARMFGPRSWVCPKCGAGHDRDLNAARNIEREGLRQVRHPEDTGEMRAFGG